MKRNFLSLLLTLLSVIASAQNEPPVLKDFAEGISEVITSFPVNDHLGVMQLNSNDKEFDLVAVNDQMKVVWKKTLAGYAMTADKIGDKIIAVAVTEYKFFKGKNSTYKGYIIDPKTGDVLLEKILYEGSEEFMEFPVLLTTTGSTFKLCVRRTAVKRKMHMPLPGPLALVSLNSYAKEYKQTKDMTVIDFNERLEPVNTFKPEINDGVLLAMEANKQGDVFIVWFKEGHIVAQKYEAGKTMPKGQVVSDLALTGGDYFLAGNHMKFFPSTSSRDVIYYSLMYLNSDKDGELGLGKFDFSNGKNSFVAEAFSKNHIKAIEKSFVSLNKKMNDADLGNSRLFDVKYLSEEDGKLVVAISGKLVQASAHATGINEYSILINRYNTDLQLKFQQVLPAQYVYINRSLPTGFNINKEKLYVIANDKRGMATLNGLYGVLDLNSGKWDKMEWLTKKKIDSYDLSDASHAFWFAEGFVLPYMNRKGLTGQKHDITLQLNTY